MRTQELEVVDLSKNYGKGNALTQALKGVSFSMNEGEFLSVMGPSGSGKSTLLNLIATLDRKSGGKIVIGGESLDDVEEKDLAKFRREKLGFIFQDFSLLDSLSAYDNIALPLCINRMDPQGIRAVVTRLAETLGIGGLLDKYPYECSGGEKSRIASARALANSPELLLADEPTGALDSKSSLALLESLRKFNESNGTTILMVTHDPFAASFSSRLLFLEDGLISKEIVRKGSRKEFFDEIMEIASERGE
ncbi:MAG: ABC transporter ATP-binding protein [Bacilli bacterium]|jgi:putative ABC transport system ATP-binding protein|nr:ABC transporter ATP-binding protein [Bacilli bacterium]